MDGATRNPLSSPTAIEPASGLAPDGLQSGVCETCADLIFAIKGLLAPSDPMNPTEYAPRVEYARAAIRKATAKDA